MENLNEATEMAIQKRDENKCALCGSEDNVVIRALVAPKSIKGGIRSWQAACLCVNCRRIIEDFFDFRGFLLLEHREQMRRAKYKEADNGNEEQISDGGSK